MTDCARCGGPVTDGGIRVIVGGSWFHKACYREKREEAKERAKARENGGPTPEEWREKR